MSVPYRFILREILVNFLGYKLGLRSLLGKGKHINITGKIDRDLYDKGVKHREIVEEVLQAKGLTPVGYIFGDGPRRLMLHGCMVINDGWERYVAVDAFASDVWSEYPISVLEKYSGGLDGTAKCWLIA